MKSGFLPIRKMRRDLRKGNLPTSCPTPEKRQFATEEAAQLALIKGSKLRPYPCECRWWHLSSKRVQK